MSDGHDGGTEHDPAASGPPPGFGGSPIGAPPPGFAGPLPGAGAAAPPTVPTAPTVPPRPPAAAPKRSILPVIALVVAAVVLIGIGVVVTTGGDEDPDPAAAAEAFATAIDERDAPGACALLTEEAEAAVAAASGARCREGFELLFIELDGTDTGPFEVVDVERDGDEATLVYDWAAGGGELPMALVDGEWRLTEFAAGEPQEPAAEGDAGDDADPGSEGPTGTSQACATELRAVETAVEIYMATNGEPPADAQALVDERLLRSLPTRATVEPDGTVVPAGDCA